MGSRKKDSSAAGAAPLENDERQPWHATQDKDDGTTFVIDAQGDAVALILTGGMGIARTMAASHDLLSAAKKVLAGLNARIEMAPGSAVPVFDGIAELSDAISKAEREVTPVGEARD